LHRHPGGVAEPPRRGPDRTLRRIRAGPGLAPAGGRLHPYRWVVEAGVSTVRGGWDRYAVAWARRHGGYDLRRAPVQVRRGQPVAYRAGPGLGVLRRPN